MSFIKGYIHFLLVFCSTCQYTLSQNCGDVELAVSTDITKFDDTYITYVGETKATDIRCRFVCPDPCVKEYIYWSKDSALVYSSFLDDARPSGPAPEYSNRIKSVMKDGNDYVLKWNETAWEDLPAPDSPTTWEVYVKGSICPPQPEEEKIKYYRYPVLTYYADGNVVENYTDVADITDGTVNCTVLSHPTSNITLMQNSEVLSTNSSCSPFNEFESVCSLSVSNVNLSMGFHCVVEYDSPETGSFTVVTPDGCCLSGIYPPPEPGVDDAGLEWWEILLSVLGGCAFVGVSFGGIVVLKKKKCQTVDQSTNKDLEDVKMSNDSSQASQGANVKQSENM